MTPIKEATQQKILLLIASSIGISAMVTWAMFTISTDHCDAEVKSLRNENKLMYKKIDDMGDDIKDIRKDVKDILKEWRND